MLSIKSHMFILTFGLIISSASAQKDSIIFINNEYIVGAVKSMDRGVLIMETGYSDSDFMIEWEVIKEIYTQHSYLITPKGGRPYIGRLESFAADSVNLITEDSSVVKEVLSDVLLMEEVNKRFKDRFTYAMDLGFNLTKARNLRQYTSRIMIVYQTEKWSVTGTMDALMSTREEAETIRRWDSGLNFSYIVPNNWALNSELRFFSSTEQRLKLRSIIKLGVGKSAIHSNRVNWVLSSGLTYNHEAFSTDIPDRKSVEGFLGTELNLLNITNVMLTTSFNTYPNLTEAGRWRYDFVIDLKYDLPLDFYIMTAFTYNFDNRPVEGASGEDYVLQTGFGWKR